MQAGTSTATSSDGVEAEPPACSCHRRGADHAVLADLLAIRPAESGSGCQWQRGHLEADDHDSLAEAACLIADYAMRWRCRGASANYLLWRDAVNSGVHLVGNDRKKVTPFFQTVFGIPGKSKPIAHLCGWVAEFVWYQVLQDRRADRGRLLKHLEGPDFHATSPGGDGLAVWEDAAQPSSYRFCLWEIKNHVGKASISGTISGAYKQLDERATEYLAKMTGISVAADTDPELVDLFSDLVTLWVDDSEKAGAGIAVSTHRHLMPDSCFTTMQEHFPGKTAAGQLEGLVAAIADFEAFSTDIQARIWNAL